MVSRAICKVLKTQGLSQESLSSHRMRPVAEKRYACLKSTEDEDQGTDMGKREAWAEGGALGSQGTLC